MSNRRISADESQLRRLSRVKQSPAPHTPMFGPELITFFKQHVQKRQTKFAPVAECWAQLVPETLIDHTALESFSHGTLTVLVDSSSHLYELKQLLLAGLQKQILIACKSTGLKKIMLKLGRWYDANSSGDRRLRF